jgi:hypothetical protein
MRPTSRARGARLRCEALEPRELLATLTVTTALDGAPGSLRDAIARAEAGDTIRFAPALRGATLPLTAGELAITRPLTIQGSGQALDADGRSRVLRIEGASGVTIADLSFTDGLAEDTADFGFAGGGVYIVAAEVSLRGVRLVGNRAVGAPSADPNVAFAQPGQGAGLFAIGSRVSLDHAVFLDNRAVGSENTLEQQAGGGLGGALAAYNSTLTVLGGRFEGNVARGGAAVNPMRRYPTSFGGAAQGGAVALFQTDATFNGSVFHDNATVGGQGLPGRLSEFSGGGPFEPPQPGGGGNSSGGAVFLQGGGRDAPSPTLTLVNVTMTSNVAQGGPAGSPKDNTQPAVQGGTANGGALAHVENAVLVIQQATFDGNRALGGAGAPNAADAGSDTGTGGVAFGGTIFTVDPRSVVVSGMTLSRGLARGGTGGDSAPGGDTEAGEGGFAYGGGWFLRNSGGMTPEQTGSPPVTITRSTFRENTARGGDPGQGPAPADDQGAGGLGQGGGMSLVGQLDATLIDVQFLDNQAVSGAGKPASGGGLAIPDGGPLSRTVIQGGRFRGNRAVGGADPGLEEFRSTSAEGGAILNNASGTTIVGARFEHNTARGGPDTGSGFAGTGRGGAIASILAQADHRLEVIGSTFRGNRALGGDVPTGTAGPAAPGSGGAQGGAIYNDVGTVRVTGGTFAGNQAQASARGDGRLAAGGAIYNSFVSSPPGFDYKTIVSLANVAFTGNAAVAFGAGRAGGGAIAHQGTSLEDAGSTFRDNAARTVGGGTAMGGALWIARAARLTGTRVVSNAAEARRATARGPVGQGFGGGIAFETDPVVPMVRTRVAHNRATTADPNISGRSGVPG